jgi:aspartyl-tRNA(Asn)/glutamyl-tRNA(Gln) amidotransferase subunit A
VSLPAARGLGHSDEPHVPSLGSLFGASSSLDVVARRKKADHGFTLFSLENCPHLACQLDPVIAPAVRSAESLCALDYLARVARLADLARAAAARLDTVDVIASPTLCLTPPLMSEVADADSHLRINRRIVRNTGWVNYLGLCAVTMPVGRDRAGMLVGLRLTAPARADETLLTIALAVEGVLGTRADRLGTPPLLAA